MAEFFTRNIIIVYFFYGLSFFVMGLAVLLEFGHSSKLDFARALRPLIGFGLVHGGHEWFEMFLIMRDRISGPVTSDWVLPVRVSLLAISFLFLIAFGARLIAGPGKRNLSLGLLAVISGIWVVGLLGVIFNQSTSQSRAIAADVYTRYALAIPGALLTVWGLILQRKRFIQIGMSAFGQDVLVAAIAFGLYGAVICISQHYLPIPVLKCRNFSANIWFSYPGFSGDYGFHSSSIHYTFSTGVPG
jgi:hypothetical protein